MNNLSRILIADDDAVFWATCLRAENSDETLDIEIALTPAQYRTTVAEQEFDLVILDISFGVYSEDGFDLLSDIRRRRPATKVVMFSGMDHPAIVASAKRLGAHGFLSKGALTPNGLWSDVKATLKLPPKTIAPM